MNKPITVLTYPGSWAKEHKRALEALGARVVEVKNLEQAKENYAIATHILLQGGADISPSWYKQNRNGAHGIDFARDQAEYAMVWSALKHGKPVMGVCRGHQMVAVAAGASLIQDIEQHLNVRHGYGRHEIKTVKGSLQRHLLGVRFDVNSYHHQAVLRAPKGFKVTARSKEGLIEALEGPKVLTVQWHPEAMLNEKSNDLSDESFALYDEFLHM